MKKLYDPFWIGVTVVLLIIFVILLPISIIEKHGVVKTIVFTLVGLIFIWVTYFVRAYFFSDDSEKLKG
jgi:c-di-AMP phosphodiesterase-like protein